jgi:hypothetical protein
VAERPEDQAEDLPRSILGYKRDDVEARLDAERERLREAEAEAERLGAKLDDRDRRLKQALEELDKARREAAEKGRAASRLDELRQSPTFAGADPDDEGGIARALEAVYAEMWRGVGRLGDRAAERGGRFVARALLFTGLADAGVGRRRGASAGEPIGATPADAPGEMRGAVELDVGPLGDFAQLTAFEDAVKGIEGVATIRVKSFSGGRATVAVELDGDIDLVGELERAAPTAFSVREAHDGRVVLDVNDGQSAAA